MTEYPSLAAALAAVQADLPSIHKGRTARIPGKNGASGYSYQYADLSDVSETVLPRLGAAGLAWTCAPTLDPDVGAFGLRYALTHAGSGQAEGGFYPLPDPRSTPAQTLGSAITYARRYVLCCVTGVVPDEDDDGQAATASPVSDPRREEPAVLVPLTDPDERTARAAEMLARAQNARSVAVVVALGRDAGLLGIDTEPVAVGDETLPLGDALRARYAELRGPQS